METCVSLVWLVKGYLLNPFVLASLYHEEFFDLLYGWRNHSYSHHGIRVLLKVVLRVSLSFNLLFFVFGFYGFPSCQSLSFSFKFWRNVVVFWGCYSFSFFYWFSNVFSFLVSLFSRERGIHWFLFWGSCLNTYIFQNLIL